MIMRESLVLLAIGVAVGLPLTIAGTRGIQNQLFGMSPSDPLTFLISIAVISGMTLVATWMPATRASRVDPLVALRYE